MGILLLQLSSLILAFTAIACSVDKKNGINNEVKSAQEDTHQTLRDNDQIKDYLHCKISENSSLTLSENRSSEELDLVFIDESGEKHIEKFAGLNFGSAAIAFDTTANKKTSLHSTVNLFNFDNLDRVINQISESPDLSTEEKVDDLTFVAEYGDSSFTPVMFSLGTECAPLAGCQEVMHEIKSTIKWRRNSRVIDDFFAGKYQSLAENGVIGTIAEIVGLGIYKNSHLMITCETLDVKFIQSNTRVLLDKYVSEAVNSKILELNSEED